MGKMQESRARELCWEYEGKGVLIGSMTTTQMNHFFDDRFIFKKMYSLYNCESFTELARYLTKRIFVCGADKIPEDIVEDMVSEEVGNITRKLQSEIVNIRRICTVKYRWKSFEKKFITKQDIYDQYTDHSDDSYEWYKNEFGATTSVKTVYQGEFFRVYETYVSFTKYNDTYVTTMAVVVPVSDLIPKEDSV